jgi:hypothetical protein
MTATPGGKDGDLEEKVVTHLGLRVVQDQAHKPRLQAEKSSSDATEYLLRTLPLQPVLVYCTEAESSAWTKDYKCVVDDKILDDEVLENLEQKTGDKYLLLITTKVELMRAIDYRAPNVGISLLLCKPFSNEREAQ